MDRRRPLVLLTAALAALAVLLVLIARADRPAATDGQGARSRSAESPDPSIAPGPDGEPPAEVASRGDPGCLEGTVLLAGENEDRPLPGARVRSCMRRDAVAGVPWVGREEERLDSETIRDVFVETEADARGEFLLDLPAGRSWLLIATAAGVGMAAVEWEQGDPPVTIVLEAHETRALRVVDTDGAPVAGAEILRFSFLRDEGPRPAVDRILTDGGGRFSLPLDEYSWLLIRAPGFADLGVDEADGRTDDTIVLPRAARIAGIVVDDAGAPVDNASVTIDREGWTDLAVTDAAGRFAFAVPADGGERYLVTEKTGHVTADRLATAGEIGVRLVLSRAGSISGRVLLRDGDPATGARLEWFHPASRDGARSERADDDGRFALGNLPPGTVILWAGVVTEGTVATTTQEHRRVLDLPAGKRLDVTIRLEAVAVSYLRLRILDMNARPLPESRPGSRATPSFETEWEVNEEGIALAAFALPPGTAVRLHVSPSRRRMDLEPTELVLPTVGSPDTEPQTVVLKRPPPITVLVRTPDGKPLTSDREAEVSLGGNPIARKGPDRFVSSTLAWMGSNLLVKVPDVGSAFRRLSEEDRAEGVVDVLLAPETVVTGRVTVAAGRPPFDGHVWLRRPDFRWAGGVRADPESGRFEFRGVAPGPLLLSLHPTDGDGEFRIVMALDAEPGRAHDVGEIPVEDTARLSARVLLPDGSPAAGARLSIRALDDDEMDYAFANGEGQVSVRWPRVSRGRMEIRASGCATASLAIPEEPTDRSLTVKLEPEGPVHVRLEPAPPIHATVGWGITHAGRKPGWGEIERRHAVGTTGVPTFVLHQLPVGDVEVRASTTDARGRPVHGTCHVRVTPGSTREVVIRLRVLPE